MSSTVLRHGAAFRAARLAAALLFAGLIACRVPAASPAENGPADNGSEAAETPGEIGARHAREREEMMAKAKNMVETTDQAVLGHVPASVKTVAGARLFDISLWRYITAGAVIFLALAAWLFVRRRHGIRLAGVDPASLGGWHLAMHVALLGLRNPVKLFLFGCTLRIVSSLIVTRYHPEILWTADMAVYFAFIFYLYDLVALVDKFYGQWLFSSPDRLLDTVRPFILKAARVLLLLVAGVHVYQSITGQTLFSIIAGLGIGGLALALASQETLKNLLGFANIAFDQPFLVGDAVVIGSDDGTVEHVGIRSLRIRKYDGSCVVIPNSTVIASNVLNKSRLPFLRRRIGLSLHPNNGTEKVELAIRLVEEVLRDHGEAMDARTPPTVRFEDYEPARLIVAAYFWFDQESGRDCAAEVDLINREIYRRLSEAGVAFAER